MGEVIRMPEPRAGSIMEALLRLLRGVRGNPAGTGWLATCPTPEHAERGVECAVWEGPGGEPRLACPEGCDDLVARDVLFPRPSDLETTDPWPFGLMPAEEFLAIEYPPTRWLYRDLVAAESTTVLFSAPNAGKTFLATEILAEIAAGALARGISVAVLEYEGTPGAFQTRLRRSLRAHRVGAGRVAVSHNPSLDIMDADACARLAAWTHAHMVDLVIIDSLAAASGDLLDENDAREMGTLSANMRAIQVAGNTSVLALHHMTKAAWAPGEKPSLASMRGHSKLPGRVDTALAVVGRECDATAVRFELHVLKQRENQRVSPRYYEVSLLGEEATVTISDLDANNSAGGGRPDRDQRDIAMSANILSFLRGCGEEGASINWIERHVEGNGSKIRASVQALHAAGEVERFERRGYFRFKLSSRNFTTAASSRENEQNEGGIHREHDLVPHREVGGRGSRGVESGSAPLRQDGDAIEHNRSGRNGAADWSTGSADIHAQQTSSGPSGRGRTRSDEPTSRPASSNLVPPFRGDEGQRTDSVDLVRPRRTPSERPRSREPGEDDE